MAYIPPWRNHSDRIKVVTNIHALLGMDGVHATVAEPRWYVWL